MAEKSELRQPTHRAYSVIRREGQEDFWLNLDLCSTTRMERASTSCCRPSLSTARSCAARSRPRTSPRTHRWRAGLEL